MTQDTTPASGAVAKPFEDPAPPFNKWRGEMQAALKSSGIYAARSPGTGNKLTLRWRETRKAVQPAHQWDVGYPQLPEPDIAVCNDGKAWIFTNKDVVGEPYYTADQMRAYVDSDRAARKQGANHDR